ncbi:hypothetical protein RN001_016177 [Aquatica leii]|uniref:BolA-like protein 3 n=1 Tax=Aquatica leii TaxID=1421715 RepID=A0AAN7SKB2_9COLE|nr:hypothetical protein RN001_016177 [Aquatica leii]
MNIVQKFTNSLKEGSLFKHGFLRHWYGTENKTSEQIIRAILKEKFPAAKFISVEDTSGGCGAMYNIYIESDTFKNLSIPKQHKAVYSALEEQIKLIHGLHVQTKIPS